MYQHNCAARFQTAIAGGGLALLSGAHALVIDSAVNTVRVDDLWQAVQRKSGFQDTLDILTANGLTAAPSFALIELLPEGVRVLVRGPVTVTVTGTGPARLVCMVDGVGVSTWVERIFTDVGELTIDLPGAVVAADVEMLPLVAGAALVVRLELQVAAFGDVHAPGNPAVRTQPVDPGVTVTELPVESEEGNVDHIGRDFHTDTDTEIAAGDGYDYLFGATVIRTVADAAVFEPVEPERAVPTLSAASVEGPLAGDHDGHTVLTSDIAKLRAERKSSRATTGSEYDAVAQFSQPVEPRAARVVLVLADGTREHLMQPILVGRSPSVSQVSGGQLPRLLTVGTPDQDISRTHVRFALEGGTVVVTDLHSRNGTMVKLPGKEPQKLRAGDPTAVLFGTIVDLGGGITLAVQEDSGTGDTAGSSATAGNGSADPVGLR